MEIKDKAKASSAKQLLCAPGSKAKCYSSPLSYDLIPFLKSLGAQ
jgi:hypothetical protein